MASSDNAPKYNTPSEWASSSPARRDEAYSDAPSGNASSGDASSSGSSGSADWRVSMREASSYADLGLKFFAAIVIFAGGGYLLDQQFGTRPWLTLLGVGVAMVAILTLVIRLSTEASKAAKAKREAKANRPRSSYGSD